MHPTTATQIHCTDTHLQLTLTDGRELRVPFHLLRRLAAATPAQRADCRLIGPGTGIHWPQLDEDLRVAGLLAGWL